METDININEENNAIIHKDNSLTRLDLSVNKHIQSKEYKKSHLLSYWFEDFANYHDNETTFNTAKMRTFKRGDIIKVNLGFNIGRELGGLHYCIVINKDDKPQSGVINVIPLTSLKEGTDFYHNNRINLGNELYELLIKKVNKLKLELTELTQSMRGIQNLNSLELSKLSQKLDHLSKIESEIGKMKEGSIALINQITTVSKQRIFKTPVLNGIKISPETLTTIDNKVKELFTKI